MNGLGEFNRAPADDVIEALQSCCASAAWAQAVAERRPYESIDELIAIAELQWWQLPRLEWVQAFGAHPRIGERAAATPQAGQGDAWSEEEQSAARATRATAARLAELNRAYEEKFGYTYIVSATGKTAEEMISIAERRMTNEPDAEVRIAAEEQARITGLRLRKLLSVQSESAE